MKIRMSREMDLSKGKQPRTGRDETIEEKGALCGRHEMMQGTKGDWEQDEMN